jgi:hypothetical protein
MNSKAFAINIRCRYGISRNFISARLIINFVEEFSHFHLMPPRGANIRSYNYRA